MARFAVNFENICFFLLIVFVSSTAYAADITVSSPANGASVGTSFKLVASSSTCSSQTVASMGYSLDNSSSTTVVDAKSISASVSTSAGSHVLHVKSWGTGGSSCSVAVDITVTAASGPSIPSDATVSANIDTNTSLDWEYNHDPGTSGTSTGTTKLVSSLDGKGESREYSMSYDSSGGEIYHVTFANDPNATHFVYENYVYIDKTADIANLEMDMNQVIPNGDTVIYGFQCDGSSNTWDYTFVGTVDGKYGSHWAHSSAACNPRNWTPNAWHHVQIAYYRDSSGNVTYESVYLDGVEAPINVTVSSVDSLGWAAGALLTNFQIDGVGASGSVTAYSTGMTVSYW